MASTRWHSAGGSGTALSCPLNPGPTLFPNVLWCQESCPESTAGNAPAHTAPSLGAGIQLQLESSGCSDSATVSHTVKDVTMIQSWKHQQFTWKEGDGREPVSHFCTRSRQLHFQQWGRPWGCSALGQVTWSVQLLVPIPVGRMKSLSRCDCVSPCVHVAPLQP